MIFLDSMIGMKGIAVQTPKKVAETMDLFVIGITNLTCLVSGAMPVSISYARSQLNINSGATSMISGLVNGMLCGIFG